jgi:hypothetical protein
VSEGWNATRSYRRLPAALPPFAALFFAGFMVRLAGGVAADFLGAAGFAAFGFAFPTGFAVLAAGAGSGE